MSSSFASLCEVHQGLEITYICCTPGCMAFLCAQCIPEHCTKHMSMQAYADLQLLGKLAKDCEAKLKANIEASKNQELEEQESIKELENTKFKDLQEAKECIMYEVNNFFLKEGAVLREMFDKMRANAGSNNQSKKLLEADFDRLKKSEGKDAKLIAELLSRTNENNVEKPKHEECVEVLVNKIHLENNFKGFLEDFCKVRNKRTTGALKSKVSFLSPDTSEESRNERSSTMRRQPKAFISAVMRRGSKDDFDVEKAVTIPDFLKPSLFDNSKKRVLKLKEAVVTLVESNNFRELIVDLNYNKVGNSGVAEISAALANNKTIRTISLFLAGNAIDDSGLSMLLKGLKENRTICQLSLYLGSNGLTNKGAENLMDYLKSNNTIENITLSLYECSCSPGSQEHQGRA